MALADAFLTILDLPYPRERESRIAYSTTSAHVSPPSLEKRVCIRQVS
jgi:hypothetical protein